MLETTEDGEVIKCEVMWEDYFTKEEYMVLDERWEKFVQRLNELWDKWWNIHDYAIAYSPSGVIKSAVLYRYTKVYNKEEETKEFIDDENQEPLSDNQEENA